MNNNPKKLQAYELIRNHIVNCIYAPGTMINEELIREEIDASRTPIRDALSRLEQEGLVKILPKKGILVTPITLEGMNMLYEARELIEPNAIRHYGYRISRDIYKHYQQQYTVYLDHPESEYSFSTMDSSFHQCLVDATQNIYLMNLYSTIESQIRRTRILTGRIQRERLKETAEEHLIIVRAALQEDWEAAGKAMQEHLAMSKKAYLRYLQENETDLIEYAQVMNSTKGRIVPSPA